jgi:hypothetical protein
MMNRVFRSTAGKRAFSSGVVFTPDYAFEMASSTVRVGRGVTKEVGQDLLNLGLSKNVCVFTDPYMATLPPMKAVLESLTKAKIQFDVFDRVAVEPTDASLQIAIQHCKAKNYDGFIAVGGGSVMDTAKAANVYMCNPNNEFLDFVNAPVGKGMPVPNKLKPLIAIPTTAGTGSETTGVGGVLLTPPPAPPPNERHPRRPPRGGLGPPRPPAPRPEFETAPFARSWASSTPTTRPRAAEHSPRITGWTCSVTRWSPTLRFPITSASPAPPPDHSSGLPTRAATASATFGAALRCSSAPNTCCARWKETPTPESRCASPPQPREWASVRYVYLVNVRQVTAH